MDWLMILISPFVIVFIYPVIILITMYGGAVFLHVYRHRRRQIYDAYADNFWDGGQQTIAAVFDAHGTLWHGYELIGIEKLPAEGPALLIYYHGALPLDMYYILARLILCKKRRVRNVAATFLFQIPGIQLLLEVCGAVEGRSREQCVQILKIPLHFIYEIKTKGYDAIKVNVFHSDCKVMKIPPIRNSSWSLATILLTQKKICLAADVFTETVTGADSLNGEVLAISPGGVREALFSDEYYTMIWNGRRGFAKVALEAKVPIYPIYTQNIREAIRSVQIGRKWFRKLYEWTKLPLVPLYGGFPVKLRTFIGEPILYDPKLSCDELAGKVQRDIQKMIEAHQQLPGSIISALQARWESSKQQ